MVETMKFALMFIDIFIPYTFLFFMIVGGEDRKDTRHGELYSFADIVRHFAWIFVHVLAFSCDYHNTYFLIGILENVRFKIKGQEWK